ncbi:hypothetical protein V1477_018168 [Vespula maculifrons]|uniref:Uncharacterized protein n=1 Tax=Vespula maculifrons TaxID=7453 RepID=A0ABD2AZ31_VESMC
MTMALVGDGNGDSVDRQPIDGLVLQMRVERSSAENRWNDVVPLSPSKPAATSTATTRTTTMATATATATTTTAPSSRNLLLLAILLSLSSSSTSKTRASD